MASPSQPFSARALVNRAGPRAVALETTLLAHGVPAGEGLQLGRQLAEIVHGRGASPALVGVVDGRPTVGMTDAELDRMLAGPPVPKLNTATLGLALHRGQSGATTVATTMELAAGAGVRVFATGGLGGVHKGFAQTPDISADLAALARFPVAVVCAGVKSILDVRATREALESLGVPVIGFGTDRFPAFYLRIADRSSGGIRVDARFDDPADLSRFLRQELARTGRAVVIARPIDAADELDEAAFSRWLAEAESAARAESAAGRDITPRVLAHLHRVSDGATLRANIALVKQNTDLAAQLAAAMG